MCWQFQNEPVKKQEADFPLDRDGGMRSVCGLQPSWGCEEDRREALSECELVLRDLIRGAWEGRTCRKWKVKVIQSLRLSSSWFCHLTHVSCSFKATDSCQMWYSIRDLLHVALAPFRMSHLISWWWFSSCFQQIESLCPSFTHIWGSVHSKCHWLKGRLFVKAPDSELLGSLQQLLFESPRRWREGHPPKRGQIEPAVLLKKTSASLWSWGSGVVQLVQWTEDVHVHTGRHSSERWSWGLN